MSNSYKAIQWNKQKKTYDLILWLGIVLLLASFSIFQFLLYPNITVETLIIRATALCSIVLLHIILAIGPLCRINNRFLPFLYNRRHMGVSFFIIALIHSGISIVQFHALGDINPIVSVFTSNQAYLSISEFPFQILGFLALIIFLLMAITSHDYWLKNLSPRIWKGLHMSVYVAYALIILHVALGALQYESHPVYFILLLCGFISIAFLHLFVGYSEFRKLKQGCTDLKDFVSVCAVADIPEDCAKTVFIGNENIAIFKYNERISAVNNVCKHQMGPLGEGKIIDGCITCPWHGYQYNPADGTSPPPFKEKVSTYDTKIINGIVWVNPIPHQEGTYVEPVKLDTQS